jgi:hypothetical protein
MKRVACRERSICLLLTLCRAPILFRHPKTKTIPRAVFIIALINRPLD